MAQLREGVSLSLPVPDVGCFSDSSDVGWGGPRRRTPRLWSPHQKTLHQPERASSSSVWPEGLRTPVGGPVGSTVLRQHHHNRLSSSFGRNVLFHSERHSKGDTPLGGEPPSPSPGLVQCHSGRSQSPQSGDRVGMDPSSGGSRSTGPQMASGDRSVCDLPDREASSVFLTGLRFAGSGNGCSSPTLGQSPSLCLSSDRHHKESSCQTEVLEELRVDSHRSVLASEGMVPGPLELLSDVPITLSGRKNLLRQPHFHRFHQNLPMFQLTAWRLSSDSPVRPASLLRWLDNLSSVEDCPHT